MARTGTSDGADEPGHALAFETSGLIGCVALGMGPGVLAVKRLGGPRRHAVDFVPAIAEICRDHGVEPRSIGHVYVSSGPGSFTGLRIGVIAARMIARSTGARIVAVPTLEVIAQNALDAADPPQRVAVILDAKRRRVYAAAFVRRGERYAPATDGVEADPERFLADQAAASGSCGVLGEGIASHREAVKASGLVLLADELHAPRAETVYRLGYEYGSAGGFTDPGSLVPTYIRPPEAEEKWAQRHPDRRS